MDTNDTEEHNQDKSESAESYGPFIPMTPKTSEVAVFRNAQPKTKHLATKTMMQRAINALSTNSRKGFSLASIRNYIMQNFLQTPSGLKNRMPFMKKFFRTALETGELVSVKGIGLTGSFRVPQSSSLHKNAKKTKMQNKMKLKRKTAKGIIKRHKTKNVKKAKRTFSANM